MLKTENLGYAYAGSPPLRFPNIECAKGEHWLVLGESGSGKTTLLHLLGGLLSPKEGRIILGDTEMNQLSRSALDQFRGQHIGIIFQTAHFVQSLSVGDNLALAQSLAGMKVNRKRIRELLGRLGLEHKLRSKPSQLSVGEKQRASIARAIINQPAVILADEPTSALDDSNCKQVIELLEEQAQAVNATLLVVTHDARLKDHISHQISID
ncbi:ATP-binding cassette domain-containing protein [Phaeodactylibacter sp.]|jgi:putative ABC transport system ATP-binding protein|uniref:ABC transporter ATP-binding protein n=1 Tax=Phaeodactylibacter sp. TaxID=1940289 RepID=UPI0025E5C88B|nr:ATP-binding cassette domain-containing protein [Phaeodactylibacter sp.]MCI4647202.1 ATP-binding cassette domain-containing protein [Phaeodactylibacter sp.]MCI5093927.1 ATP-binding cassette domain-containing protein [Phaeodactylibacter sp.]